MLGRSSDQLDLERLSDAHGSLPKDPA